MTQGSNPQWAGPPEQMIDRFPDSEVRSYCKARIEGLELWLRRLIDLTLSQAYGDYWQYEDQAGHRLISKYLVGSLEKRVQQHPDRFPRKVDAIFFEDAISIICNPQLYKRHFAEALRAAFPGGCAEVRTFMERLVAPRNKLSHANPLSVHEAERVICYTSDLIASMKRYYAERNLSQEYDVPTIIRLTDWVGNTFHRSQLGPINTGGVIKNFKSDPQYDLRPGDTVALEVEVDPSYPPSSYSIGWRCSKGSSGVESTSPRLVLPITAKHVTTVFEIQCRIKSDKDWHKLSDGSDDIVILDYRVLPPL